MIARALNFDPAEFRRKNLLREGDVHPTGQRIDDAPLEEVLNTVLEGINWGKALNRESGTIRCGRGFGIARP
jgi:CO/xanthine dehydrogenase Mo-binding subunit